MLRNRHSDVSVDQPDHTPPADEFLVLDADASQSYVINAALAGSDLVIQGPPGTGKSQTIANLIATLAARGRRVLFVAEKRAAIDAVLDRLNRAGLGDLVLDLHGGAGSRRKLAQDLAKAMADHARQALPDVAHTQRTLGLRRETLRNRCEALHSARTPWGVSIYEVQSRLLGLPATASTTAQLRRDSLEAMGADAYRAAQEELRDYVELGGLSLESQEGSSWATAMLAGTITSADQAREAHDAAATLLHRTLPSTSIQLGRVVASCGIRRPERIGDWTPVLELLANVSAALDQFDAALFSASVEELAAALAPASRNWLGRVRARVGSSAYRKACKELRSHWRAAKPKARDLHVAAVAASDHLARWRTIAIDGGRPRLPDDLAGARSAFEQLSLELKTVSDWVATPHCDQLSEAQVADWLDALVADRVTLFRVPDLHRLRQSLIQRGLGELLAEATRRKLDARATLALLEYMWLTSILEAVSFSDSVVGAFDGAAHSRTVSDFQSADRAHVATGPARVRRAVAEWATRERDAHPGESDVVRRQASLKRRHLPVRQLFQVAPHVLGAMKPCWAMSPLVVAQLLPLERCFDVVIFDEASQVTPADAVGALLRADRAIVAGDAKQLPPTTFFSASGGGEDDEDAGDLDGSPLTTGIESILDVMSALLPPPQGTRTLGWHYRSRDERLIAFSNAQPSLYDWSLTTFPGTVGDECLEHVLVPYRLGRVGQEDSVSDEVERVAAHILDHAQHRPDESLGVIAMGIKHANRVSETLRRARRDHPELDEWFDLGPDGHAGKEPFFVKNLERVQGDERDAIILTIGYGKSADGRMLYRFGPINLEGGERRLNVAITRARNRVTVVSSFSAADMDPDRLRSEGARMLSRYLSYAESRGANLGDVARDKPDLNPFERDVRDQLTAAGIPLVAQFGSSGYWIDYAAQHPTKPGRMVLAIECDGASYHSSATARDRDRLRQEHLENLGWVFHRIWSTDWFRNREAEIVKVVAAYEHAVEAAEDQGGDGKSGVALTTPARGPRGSSVGVAPTPRARGPRPHGLYGSGLPIDLYTRTQLVRLIRWIQSDTLLRTEEELLTEAMRELGYQRRGAKIVGAITSAIRATKS